MEPATDSSVRPPSLPPPPPPATPAPPTTEEVHYPEWDEHFLPGSPDHNLAAVEALHIVDRLTQRDRDWTAIDVFLYYQEHNNTAQLAPDVMVVRNHRFRGQGSYRVWIEGKLPDFVLEIISPSSKKHDAKLKKEVYERLGIQEYFLYHQDPSHAFPRLVGYRQTDAAQGEGYRELPVAPDGAIRSQVLNATLRPSGLLLRAHDLSKNEDIPTRAEAEAAQAAARARAKRAEAAEAAASARAEREAERRAQAEAAEAAASAKAERAEAAEAAASARAERAEAERQAERARAERAEAATERVRREVLRLKRLLAQR